MQAVTADARRRPWTAAAHALLSAGVTIVAAVVGSVATMSQIPTWYAGLAKPFFTPPNWVFGPAWTILYAVMAFAFWRILQKPAGTPGRQAAIIAFAVQLVLNALWSVVFFGMNQPGLALLVVVLLEAGVLTMIQTFRRVDPLAGWINLPYAAWVAFATALNIGIVWLNGPSP